VIPDIDQTRRDLCVAELFVHLDEAQVERIASVARPLVLPAEHTIFLRGDPASAFYLLAEGRVKVYKLLRDGRTATIRHVSPRQTFAEAAVFHETYPSSAETMSPSRLYRFETGAFRKVLLAEPQLAVNLLGAMAELLALLNRRVEELLLPVPARLARYLLALADEQPSGSDTVRLPISKRELAARLGTVPETLSRTFDRLKRGGILGMSADRDSIVLADIEGLQRLAQD
jgi:CRP-like cAMP-binding protein